MSRIKRREEKRREEKRREEKRPTLRAGFVVVFIVHGLNCLGLAIGKTRMQVKKNFCNMQVKFMLSF